METKNATTNLVASDKEFYATVKKVPTQSVLNTEELGLMPYNNHVIVVTDPSTNQDILINFCSEGYGLLANSDFFPAFEEELNQHFNFASSYKHRNLCRFYINYTLEDKFVSIGKKQDVLYPVISIIHSYDGELGFKVLFGFFRELTQSYIYGGSLSLDYSHTENLMEGVFDEMMDLLHEFVDTIDVSIDNFKMLTERPVLDAKARIAEIVNSVGFMKSFVDEIEGQLNVELVKSKLELNDWTIYCAINSILNNDSLLNAPIEVKIKQDQKFFSWIFSHDSTASVKKSKKVQK